VLPLYLVELLLPISSLTAASSVAGTTASTPDAENEAAILEREAVVQSGAALGEATPVRADPLGGAAAGTGFGPSKWMGSAPGGAAASEPPGELSQADQAARKSAAAAAAASSSSAAASNSSRAAAARGGSMADDEENDDVSGDRPRLDINKAQSALLGPAPKQKKATILGAGSSKR
jgi:hypothetical protein